MLIDATILADGLFAVADGAEGANHAVLIPPFVGERKESHTWDESHRYAILSVMPDHHSLDAPST
jgi:hypothetical protein